MKKVIRQMKIFLTCCLFIYFCCQLVLIPGHRQVDNFLKIKFFFG